MRAVMSRLRTNSRTCGCSSMTQAYADRVTTSSARRPCDSSPMPCALTFTASSHRRTRRTASVRATCSRPASMCKPGVSALRAVAAAGSDNERADHYVVAASTVVDSSGADLCLDASEALLLAGRTEEALEMARRVTDEVSADPLRRVTVLARGPGGRPITPLRNRPLPAAWSSRKGAMRKPKSRCECSTRVT